jgi:hypothetical protein
MSGRAPALGFCTVKVKLSIFCSKDCTERLRNIYQDICRAGPLYLASVQYRVKLSIFLSKDCTVRLRNMFQDICLERPLYLASGQ